ncbi:SGNH/GDSL hydrolase family protein [Nocardioides sp. R-C-SC26]|uniref:SGNH/GDSL hydrolase family protein n=1 Tax=Nocardioides sp. R-C-SC26 TaxID=2870414 RepID=UPI001E447FE9|nr:SGNH/GDSL hydrolase family protein [Nocardioides sp. R-C-SC26]
MARTTRLGVVRALVVPVAVAALAAGLAACDSSSGSEPDARGTSSASPDDDDSGSAAPDASGEITTYVAMGDSYTAAPLFPLTDDEQIDNCLRSRKNYPSLVARELGIKVVDVSCSGASTTSMFAEQKFTSEIRPPQLDALSPETDLVTLGIGANDSSFFSKMIFDCLAIAESDPAGSPCREQNTNARGKDKLERELVAIERNVTRVVRAIGKRAPNARILFVGYPQLLPDEGSCRAKLPLAEGDYPYTLELNQQLVEAVRDGGARAGAEYVDLWTASSGHDICSRQPWVAGVRGDPKRAMGLHPYPAEQRAVADLILEMV